ncbi:hypothetical protein [Klebsiella aerogenes]|uniref:hypothetical protein n=1 Tax=Klebsiella aerogenes TaxID=548 RepID=UPI00186914D0|nr:hypothetical protein [Klebsiella aerogenes]
MKAILTSMLLLICFSVNAKSLMVYDTAAMNALGDAVTQKLSDNPNKPEDVYFVCEYDEYNGKYYCEPQSVGFVSDGTY